MRFIIFYLLLIFGLKRLSNIAEIFKYCSLNVFLLLNLSTFKSVLKYKN